VCGEMSALKAAAPLPSRRPKTPKDGLSGGTAEGTERTSVHTWGRSSGLERTPESHTKVTRVHAVGVHTAVGNHTEG
jgi:hypothetical protein